MRRSARSTIRAERIGMIISSVLAGAAALSAAALILSLAAVRFDMPDSSVSVLSALALAAGCFGCSFSAARKRRRGGIAAGLVCGCLIFAAVIVIGLFTVRIFSAGGVFSKLLIILAASVMGGISGVNTYPFRD